MRKIKIGTRGSALALRQANEIAETLKASHPQFDYEIVVIKSTGDKIKDRPLSEIGGSGLFTRELESSLLSGAVDIAVHSMKDLPSELQAGLKLAAPPKRADCRDVLILKPPYTGLSDLPRGARLGTGSIRRSLQLLQQRPDICTESIRGNIETRLNKVGELDGVVLAAAGMIRLGLEQQITQYLDPLIVIPSPGQGILGVEYRCDDKEVSKMLAVLRHEDTAVAAIAERSFLLQSGAGCHSPVGAYCTVDKGGITVMGLFGTEDSQRTVRGSVSGSISDAEKLGAELAQALRKTFEEMKP